MDLECSETNDPGFGSHNGNGVAKKQDEVQVSDSDGNIADAQQGVAAMMAVDDLDVPLENDEEIDSYKTVDEAADRRGRTLGSSLIHYLMSSMPSGVNNPKQRRSKKPSSLFEAVRGRIKCVGDHFWSTW